MAQGFIKLSDPSQCLEDVGRKYFDDLLDGGFFQKVARSDHVFDNLATKCKIGHSEYNLSIITGGLKYALLRPHGENYTDYRITHHVSFDFHLHSQRQIPKTMKRSPSQIRSILLPRPWKCEEGMIDAEKILHIIEPDQSGWVSVHATPGSVSDVIISEFQSLRALDLHDMGMKKVPHYIDTLKHLRYLDLSRNADIKALPASVTKLLYLQTLKLSHCIGLEKLPKDTKNLVNLRSLEIDGCYNLTHMPPGLGQLINLFVLSQFVVKKHVGNSHRKKSSSAFRKTSKLYELGMLKNLRGEMQIKNLTPVTDAKAALLEEKHGLQVLTLDWDIGETGFVADDYQRQLEDLKPHLDLKGLTLLGYGGSSLLHSWLNSQRNLVKISLRKCSKCTNLPPFDQFPSLQVLLLDKMDSLESINGSEEKPASRAFFPELRELQLTRMPKLEGWWKPGLFSHDDGDVPSFSQLSKLSIMDCPRLSSGTMPLFPTLVEELVLHTTSWVPFQETMKRSRGGLPLTNLCLVDVRDFQKGEAVSYMRDNLKYLRVLRLDYIQEFEGLLEGFRNATSLQELEISRCEIKAIPDWIEDLKSLTNLAFLFCPNLASLPKGKVGPNNLHALKIEDCPILEQLRLREKGADWDKIAHIPNIHFGK